MLGLYDEIEEDFHLFGVQTPITDETKFIFLLNQTFNWKLKRINDLDVTFGDDTFCYSSFIYEDPHNEEDYVYVIKNLSHDKLDNSVNHSLFNNIALSKSRPLLNKFSIYQYMIKFPQDIDSSQIKNLTLTPIEFVYNIQPINQISKKEKKYFLI